MTASKDVIITEQICQNCQSAYFKYYTKNGHQYPEILPHKLDDAMEAIRVFMLAKKYNKTKARMLVGISKRRFTKYKKKFNSQYAAINEYFEVY